MELRDVILSTLAEMEDDVPQIEQKSRSIKPSKDVKKIVKDRSSYSSVEVDGISNEVIFLKSLKERLLVLFEGLQSPNNENIEAKVDMTLNFLEYALATVDERATKIENEEKR